MLWQTIVKSRRNLRLPPNLADYEKACADFSWTKARLELDGLPDGKGLNIAHLCFNISQMRSCRNSLQR